MASGVMYLTADGSSVQIDDQYFCLVFKSKQSATANVNWDYLPGKTYTFTLSGMVLPMIALNIPPASSGVKFGSILAISQSGANWTVEVLIYHSLGVDYSFTYYVFDKLLEKALSEPGSGLQVRHSTTGALLFDAMQPPMPLIGVYETLPATLDPTRKYAVVAGGELTVFEQTDWVSEQLDWYTYWEITLTGFVTADGAANQVSEVIAAGRNRGTQGPSVFNRGFATSILLLDVTGF